MVFQISSGQSRTFILMSTYFVEQGIPMFKLSSNVKWFSKTHMFMCNFHLLGKVTESSLPLAHASDAHNSSGWIQVPLMSGRNPITYSRHHHCLPGHLNQHLSHQAEHTSQSKDWSRNKGRDMGYTSMRRAAKNVEWFFICHNVSLDHFQRLGPGISPIHHCCTCLPGGC